MKPWPAMLATLAMISAAGTQDLGAEDLGAEGQPQQ
ncbi:MAG: hypothetical protein JWL93_1131, partial [Hyphomicrobiales bacterium]|nr:hypothetical protein [Hyphomicrobiales bacterium]